MRDNKGTQKTVRKGLRRAAHGRAENVGPDTHIKHDVGKRSDKIFCLLFRVLHDVIGQKQECEEPLVAHLKVPKQGSWRGLTPPNIYTLFGVCPLHVTFQDWVRPEPRMADKGTPRSTKHEKSMEIQKCEP